MLDFLDLWLNVVGCYFLILSLFVCISIYFGRRFSGLVEHFLGKTSRFLLQVWEYSLWVNLFVISVVAVVHFIVGD